MGCFSPNSSKKDVDEKSKKPEPSRIQKDDKAQLDLQVQIRRAKDYHQRLEMRAAAFRTEALKWKQNGNKSKAVFSLKMKKLTEKGLEKIDGVVLTLETTLQQLHEARMDADVYSALKKGNEAIKELQSSASLGDFEKIYDDMQERQKANEEITAIMGSDAAEDAAYEDELNNLDKLEVEAKLPSPPTSKVKAKKEKAPAKVAAAKTAADNGEKAKERVAVAA